MTEPNDSIEISVHALVDYFDDGADLPSVLETALDEAQAAVRTANAPTYTILVTITKK